LKRGEIERGLCLLCGGEKVEAHHNDYTKPLDIIWLCSECHQWLHALFLKFKCNEYIG
jgi:hypothetical protein